jgi:hypothetical protein
MVESGGFLIAAYFFAEPRNRISEFNRTCRGDSANTLSHDTSIKFLLNFQRIKLSITL